MSSSPVSSAKAPLLSVRDLSVEYVTPRGNVRAVDNVSFDIARGEVFGLAGESGSGKSTAAMAAMRLLQPPAIITGGEVTFDGRDVLAMGEEELRSFRWKQIALVFQSAMNALNPVLTIGAQIADVIVAHEKVKESVALERAAELLKLVGIESSRLKSYPHQLSGGMRQRVVIAIALALNPPMLFMDEPTTALDVVVQKEILQQIAELKTKLGFSILFITHDLSLMLEFCDKVGILYAGRLAEVAPSKTLFTRPQHPYTRGLMASFPELHGPRRRLEGIPGSPPDMRNPPSGCRFHPRCPDKTEQCSSAEPALISLAPRHDAACHVARPYVGGSSKDISAA
jgi:peptide/nickel transport system ATP-binding protein